MFRTLARPDNIADGSFPISRQSARQLVPNPRFSAMDMQRSFIMMLMAFLHCREYTGVTYYSNIAWDRPPVWEGTSWLDMLQQILISTVAAGGFFMMMGVGLIFLFHSRLKEGWSESKTCLYLVKRGLLLILIQLTLLQCFEILAEEKIYLYVGVLIALGTNMILASLLYLFILKLKTLPALRKYPVEYLLPASLIIIITGTLQFMISSLQNAMMAPGIWMSALVLGGNYHHGVDIDINFTPIPWFPAVAFGMIIGQILYQHKDKSIKILLRIALCFLLAWLLARTAFLSGWLNAGDYKLLAAADHASLASYFCVSKYPPSIDYFLWSLGLNLLGIIMWHLAEQNVPRLMGLIQPVKIFGQCALFFFISHWFIYYGISRFLPAPLTEPSGVITLWLLGLMLLYYLCKRYHNFKSGKPKSSIWRMF